MEKDRNLIAIVGPSASGKTTLAHRLAERLGKFNIGIISLDQYYKDWGSLPLSKREKINFDKPASIDWDLLHRQVQDLKKGRVILAPCYSYKYHARLKRRIKITPKSWVIIEGLLLFHKKAIRDLFDLKVYIYINTKTSLIRRLKRDLKHRGETIESVHKRYFRDVFPMQKKYVEPQRKFADIVINGSKGNRIALKRLIKICKKLEK